MAGVQNTEGLRPEDVPGELIRVRRVDAGQRVGEPERVRVEGKRGRRGEDRRRSGQRAKRLTEDREPVHLEAREMEAAGPADCEGRATADAEDLRPRDGDADGGVVDPHVEDTGRLARDMEPAADVEHARNGEVDRAGDVERCAGDRDCAARGAQRVGDRLRRRGGVDLELDVAAHL